MRLTIIRRQPDPRALLLRFGDGERRICLVEERLRLVMIKVLCRLNDISPYALIFRYLPSTILPLEAMRSAVPFSNDCEQTNLAHKNNNDGRFIMTNSILCNFAS